MVSDLIYHNIQIFPTASELFSILRYTFQNSTDKAAEGIIFFYGKLHIYSLCHIIQDRSPLYFPDMFSCLLNIIRLRQIRSVVNISHQCLHKIMQSDDPHKTAVFIQHYCKIIPFLPHFPEDQVRTHGFRYKKR